MEVAQGTKNYLGPYMVAGGSLWLEKWFEGLGAKDSPARLGDSAVTRNWYGTMDQSLSSVGKAMKNMVSGMELGMGFWGGIYTRKYR